MTEGSPEAIISGECLLEDGPVCLLDVRSEAQRKLLKPLKSVLFVCLLFLPQHFSAQPILFFYRLMFMWS